MYLERLAQLESGNNPNAANPASSARGLYQFTNATGRQYGITDPYDVQQQQEAIKRFTADNYTTLKTALNREPTEGELYLAHQQGANGALKLLSNPDARAVDVVGQDAVMNNGGNADMTAGDFANQWVQKFEQPQGDLSGMSNEELMRIAGTDTQPQEATPDLQNISNEELMKLAGMQQPQQQEQPAQEERGAVSGLLEDWQNRANKQQDIISSQDNPLSKALQVVGNVGDATGDVIGAGYRGLMSLAPESAKRGEKALIGLVSPTAKKAGTAIAPALSPLAKLAQEHPEAMRNIEGLIGVSQLLPLAKPIGSTVESVAKKQGKNIAEFAEKLNTKTVRPTAEQLKEAAQKSYSKVASSDAVLDSSVTDSFIDDFSKGAIQDPMAAKLAGDNPLVKISDDLKEFRGQPMTLQRAEAIDQAITKRLNDNSFYNPQGTMNQYGQELLDMKQNLRDLMLSASEKGLVKGSKQGIEDYFSAIKDWAAGSQIRDIEAIAERAARYDNPATAMRTAFRTIANNQKRLNKYPEKIRPLIKQAAEDSDFANTLRTELGSRLISSVVGAGVGSSAGPLGTAVGATVGILSSKAARKGAEVLQKQRLNKIIDAIAETSSLPTQKVKRFSFSKTGKEAESPTLLNYSVKKGIKQ